MDRDPLQHLGTNPNFISGIDNYCDEWCQRCAFTARCRSFALHHEEFSDDESRDLSNDKFWDHLTSTLQASLDLLREIAAEQGFEPESEDSEETIELMARKERQMEAAMTHPCSTAAEAYANIVDQWFEAAADLFEAKGRLLEAMSQLNLPHIDPAEEANRLSDAVAVIRWHQYQIAVKLMLAFQSRETEADDPDRLAAFPKDSDGSAKIALIESDHSLAAWATLLRDFPQRETDTLKILSQLDRLRGAVEREFPAARAFQRPGFDVLDPSPDSLDLAEVGC